MAVTVEEKFGSRPGADGSSAGRELIYLARGSNDDDAILTALRAAAPATLGTSYNLVYFDHVTVDEQLGDLLWIGTAHYVAPEKREKAVGDSTFNFDTSGSTVHISTSKGTVKYAASGTAPDLQNSIGDTGDEVGGVDITVPQYSFSETFIIADSDVDATYKGILFARTGTKNNASFKGCAAGECLFLGARGSKRGNGDWEITFSFAASPNITGLTIGGITGIAKLGWDYLWVRFEPQPVGAAANKVMSAGVPKFVYVETIYASADFSDLGIGV